MQRKCRLMQGRRDRKMEERRAIVPPLVDMEEVRRRQQEEQMRRITEEEEERRKERGKQEEEQARRNDNEEGTLERASEEAQPQTKIMTGRQFGEEKEVLGFPQLGGNGRENESQQAAHFQPALGRHPLDVKRQTQERQILEERRSRKKEKRLAQERRREERLQRLEEGEARDQTQFTINKILSPSRQTTQIPPPSKAQEPQLIPNQPPLLDQLNLPQPPPQLVPQPSFDQRGDQEPAAKMPHLMPYQPNPSPTNLILVEQTANLKNMDMVPEHLGPPPIQHQRKGNDHWSQNVGAGEVQWATHQLPWPSTQSGLHHQWAAPAHQSPQALHLTHPSSNPPLPQPYIAGQQPTHLPQQYSSNTPQQPAHLSQSGVGWAQSAFQQHSNDRERVTLCFNDDISEVLNIMQQQQHGEVKPVKIQEEEKRGTEVESEMKNDRVVTVFPPHLSLPNLR